MAIKRSGVGGRGRSLVLEEEDGGDAIRTETWARTGRRALPLRPSWFHKPESRNPGWSSGRLPSGQKNLRSESLIGRSLMLA